MYDGASLIFEVWSRVPSEPCGGVNSRKLLSWVEVVHVRSESHWNEGAVIGFSVTEVSQESSDTM